MERQSSRNKRLVVLFVLMIALVGSLFAGTLKGSQSRFAPSLALDLEGGTQIILTPVATDGSEITESDVSQAIEIIRQRVDASGVAEAEISAQGGKNIVVALPGNPSKETLDLVRTSAVLRLRPVLSVMAPKALTADDIAKMKNAQANKGTDPNAQPAPVQEAPAPNLTPEQLEKEIVALADSDKDGKISDTPHGTPKDYSDDLWVTEKALYDAFKLECGSEDARLRATADDPKKASVACSSTGEQKYILGPAEIEGTNLTKASSSLATDQKGTPTGGWAVNMQFDSAGAKAFADVTGRIYQMQSPKNQFAIVLDGQVLSAPVPNGPIAGGQAQITGHFKAEEAAALANQLNFGSLPLNFEVQSEEQISATLGSEQLQAGLIAGFIGLVLIVLYMLWQYHGLGIIAIASIVLSTGLSYLVICGLSWVMGYRLSMAGVLGMIISIGVTADSFIVYFERIRDEIRDGRNVHSAIEYGWDRAKRTIIISDCVNLLASIVLYVLTVGSVRGFAFTLGITTLLDLIVVMMFTYPLMLIVIRTAFFGKGKRFSGLDVESLRRTPLYRGRGNIGGSAKTGVDAGNAVAAQEAEERTADDTEEASSVAETKATSGVKASGKPGESLAERRARERREKKKAQAQEMSVAENVIEGEEN
ncbi:preprotein translocase subunit SecD [Arcanobacterium pluranimalium]|uniref:protein translocase subunit SecD n=1 Tax=Arcanobacterium pluranimalium TaxID=108028 RepID=UPI001957BAC7|nr:protein translocase subunit SecD [Arcanobacterium pluranimalium]MBM7825466.1 preprotein translocase subunit SecD [Arcanobacterium pluranimalium]